MPSKHIGPSRVHAPAQRSGHYTRHFFSFYLSLSLSGLSALSRLDNVLFGQLSVRTVF